MNNKKYIPDQAVDSLQMGLSQDLQQHPAHNFMVAADIAVILFELDVQLN